MKDTKTSLIFRMAKRKAPKAWMIEVDALLNHIDELNGLVDTGLVIINNLQEERAQLYKLIRNTADALSEGEDLAATFRVVRQLDDLLTAAKNDGVYDDN